MKTRWAWMYVLQTFILTSPDAKNVVIVFCGGHCT